MKLFLGALCAIACAGAALAGPAPDPGRLYWSDTGQLRILRSTLDGGSTTTLIDDFAAFELAADFPGKLYWWGVQAGGSARFWRADANGTNVEELFAPQGVAVPALAVDGAGGKLYFSVTIFEQPGRILRAAPDGSDVELLVEGDSRDIELDRAADKLYYIIEAIHRANLDGTNQETLFTPEATPLAFAIDFDAGKIYWSESAPLDSPIRRADFDGSNRELLLVADGTVLELDIDVPHGKLYWTELETGNLLRANLDGSNVEILFANAGATSLVLDPLGQGSVVPALSLLGVVAAGLLFLPVAFVVFRRLIR